MWVLKVLKCTDTWHIIKGTTFGVRFHLRALWHCCTELLSSTAYDDIPKSASLRTLFVTIYITGMLLLGCYSAGFITNLTLRDPALPFTDFEGLLKDGSYRLGMATVNEQVDYFRVSILIYLLSVSGSRTVHIYTKAIHRKTQWNRIHRTEHT